MNVTLDIDLKGLSEIRLPVRVADREGKYYGTEVVDADGRLVADFWDAEGEPSIREKEYFGPKWTPEMWREYNCDSHWESETSLRLANWLVYVLNYSQYPPYVMVRGGKAVNRFSFSLSEMNEIGQEIGVAKKAWSDIHEQS